MFNSCDPAYKPGTVQSDFYIYSCLNHFVTYIGSIYPFIFCMDLIFFSYNQLKTLEYSQNCFLLKVHALVDFLYEDEVLNFGFLISKYLLVKYRHHMQVHSSRHLLAMVLILGFYKNRCLNKFMVYDSFVSQLQKFISLRNDLKAHYTFLSIICLKKSD